MSFRRAYGEEKSSRNATKDFSAPCGGHRNDICKISNSKDKIDVSKNYYVYILTNWNDKVMYVGMTNDLKRRVYQHKHKLVDGFTAKYRVNKLVYYEETQDVRAALNREKEVKKRRREKKDRLVQVQNPTWRDLSELWNEDFYPDGHTSSPQSDTSK